VTIKAGNQTPIRAYAYAVAINTNGAQGNYTFLVSGTNATEGAIFLNGRNILTHSNTASLYGTVAPGVPIKVWKTDGDGLPAWRDDETGAPGSGITSINGLSAATQTIATNGGGLAVASATATHTLSLDATLQEWAKYGTNVVTNTLAAANDYTMAASNTVRTYAHMLVEDTYLTDWSHFSTNALIAVTGGDVTAAQLGVVSNQFYFGSNALFDFTAGTSNLVGSSTSTGSNGAVAFSMTVSNTLRTNYTVFDILTSNGAIQFSMVVSNTARTNFVAFDGITSNGVLTAANNIITTASNGAVAFSMTVSNTVVTNFVAYDIITSNGAIDFAKSVTNSTTLKDWALFSTNALGSGGSGITLGQATNVATNAVRLVQGANITITESGTPAAITYSIAASLAGGTASMADLYVIGANDTNFTIGAFQAGTNYAATTANLVSNWVNAVSNLLGTFSTANSNQATTILQNSTNYAAGTANSVSNWANAISNRFDLFSVANSNLAYAIGTAATNYAAGVGNTVSNWANAISNLVGGAGLSLNTLTNTKALPFIGNLSAASNIYAGQELFMSGYSLWYLIPGVGGTNNLFSVSNSSTYITNHTRSIDFVAGTNVVLETPCFRARIIGQGQAMCLMGMWLWSVI
jgi:hypothetical protein